MSFCLSLYNNDNNNNNNNNNNNDFPFVWKRIVDFKIEFHISYLIMAIWVQ